MAAKKKKKSASRGRSSVRKPTAKKKAKPAGKKATARSSRRSPVGGDSSAEGLVAQVQRLLDIMNESGAVEVEVEGDGTKLRIRREESNGGVQMMPAYSPAMQQMAAPAQMPIAGVPGAGDVGSAATAAGGDVFKSPMVGTFYRAASPDADPFVQVGDRINVDSTICILEAMKVMNEIKAETDGEIVEILVQNGEPVEYGQPLFVLKPI